MSTRTVGYLGGEGAAAYLTLTTALTESSNLRDVVKMTANNTAGTLTDGATVLGQIVAFSPDESQCTVKVKGILTNIPYNAGTLPAIGDPIQGQGDNSVDIGVAGSIAPRGTVIAVDTSAVTLTVLL